MHKHSTENNDDYSKILEQTINIYQKSPKDISIPKIIDLYENSQFNSIPFEVIKISNKDNIKIETSLAFGKYLLRYNKLKEALSAFEVSLKIDPANTAAWAFTVITLRKIGAKKAADNKITEALKKTKRHPGIVNLKSPYASNNIYANKCLTTDKLDILNALIQQKPKSIDVGELAYYHYAFAFHSLLNKDTNNALNNLLCAIEIIPTEFRFWALLSRTLLQADEPLNAYTAAVEACTLNTRVFTLDYLLLCSNKINKFYLFDNIIEAHIPKSNSDPSIINIKAKKSQLTRDYESAFKLLSKSFELDSKNPETLLNLSLLSFDAKQFQAAHKSFKKLFTLHPTYKQDTQKRFYNLLCACFLNEWDYVDSELDPVLSIIDKVNSLDTIIAAFFILSMTDDFKKHAQIAALTSLSIMPAKDITLTERFKPYKNHQKIRVGYLSGDIGEHIVSHIFLPLLNSLDRDIFEPYVFSYRPDDGSDYYKNIKAGSNFHDICKMSDRDAAILITSHEIDILVDLTLYTSASRSNIMSYRPAPIQMHHTGYPSTSGSPDIYDYMLVNKFYLSEKTLPYYSESLIIQPHITDAPFRKNEFLGKVTKADFNLPEDKLILASFNEPHKITRQIFKLWCSLLEQNKDTVLWIYAADEHRRQNILAEAKTNNLSVSRIVFADKVDFAEHRQRLHLADLLLDTFPYGNHSSAKMALESGTPIIAYRGISQASQISALHLTNAKLEQLIAQDDASFIAIANRYIQDKDFRDTCLNTLEITLNKQNQVSNHKPTAYYELALKMLYARFKDNPSMDAKQSFELPKLE
ncbi:tetratricopeptide repeat protein [Nitrincola sp.]|uniref:tetratricopeptide repeat protein n=1 Tax=Nitrincola sp. TaxID=1926584 RepID=UPI003A8E5680